VPFVDREFRTLARGNIAVVSANHRWLRRHPARHEVRQDLGRGGEHSGDAAFDFVYWPTGRNTLNELARFRAPKRKPGAYDARAEAGRKGLAEGLDDGRIKRFLAHVWKKEKVSMKETMCVMNLCMAATYDPDPRAPLGFRFRSISSRAR